ncbi:ABC transporter permease [Streptomyces sp. NPDC056390]|uniref:ABC transporter permease n=1 Tax=Streptomyces sp. NPDC056390 TaxID=3345806 RepID=UPI0035D6485B
MVSFLPLLVRRVTELVVTVFVTSVVIFSAFLLMPGDPAVLLAGGKQQSPEVMEALRGQFRLDDPVVVRYFGWLGDLVTGDFGRSYIYRADVVDLIGPRVETTLLLLAYAAILLLALGIGGGIAAGLGGKRLDRGITVLASLSMGAPTFVVAAALVTVFSLYLGWFPATGAGSGFLDQLRHLTLPALTMSLASAAFVARLTRGAVRAELHSEHVDTARSRGIAPHHYVPRDVLRNAAPQIFSVSAITIASLVAYTAVVESAFGINGIGSLLVSAASRQDLPVVQILSLCMVVIFVVVNTVIDLVNAALDPRMAVRRAGV